jgi:N-acetylneuraminic acid mutarotase
MHWGGVNTTGKVLEDIQQYDPKNNSWRNVGHLPNGGLFNHIAFSIGNQIYVGLGEDENFIIKNRLYCIHEK